MAWRDYLAPDWRQAHKLWSVQITVLSAVLDGLWLAFPVFQDWFPPLVFVGMSIGLSLTVLVVRLLAQKDVPYGPPDAK